MTVDVIHPLNTTLFGLDVYEVVSENDSHCVTQFILMYRVSTQIAFQGPG